jgi:hypothetical protein
MEDPADVYEIHPFNQQEIFEAKPDFSDDEKLTSTAINHEHIH